MQKVNDHATGHLHLRSLRFLAQVLSLRSVTRAGETMGLSQPAASRLLAQLRRALGDDPLLVRTQGGGYVRTARAEALMSQLAEVIAAEDRLFQPPSFDPSSSERVLRVATTDYGAAVVIREFARVTACEAPGVSLDLRAWESKTLVELEEGRLDFALYTDEAVPPGFHHESLFTERFACVVRHDHPVLAHRDGDGHIAPSRLAELPRVVLLYPEGSATAIDDPLALHGRARGPGDTITPYFLSSPLLIGQSERVLCLPRRAAELVAPLADLAVIDFPQAGEIHYCVIWHGRAARDPAIAWATECLRRATGR
ncbi:LysR family transcriptional regulator [Halomonas alkaliantarctica]|uniref:LysR family transcriptional regulator n=1 Tax=Halomonas alkaliantarctica TaxID=232346 RepID=A0ABY8LPQ4_9GAMM|nr:LysR family transcriptional regulator [Halomonas alkaliantarctica]WGI26397.1 LysR family transcriptional regulator [Halomonas alkaliantarctica]